MPELERLVPNVLASLSMPMLCHCHYHCQCHIHARYGMLWYARSDACYASQSVHHRIHRSLSLYVSVLCLRCAVLCSAVQYSVVQCYQCAMQCSGELCYVVLCCAALASTGLTQCASAMSYWMHSKIGKGWREIYSFGSKSQWRIMSAKTPNRAIRTSLDQSII